MMDNEIILGLKEFTSSDNPGKLSIAVRLFLEDILSYINRQQDENEDLRRESNIAQHLLQDNKRTIEELGKLNEITRAEADRYKRYYFSHKYDKIASMIRKEFAERLKEKAEVSSSGYIMISELCFDNLLAEMNGGESEIGQKQICSTAPNDYNFEVGM